MPERPDLTRITLTPGEVRADSVYTLDEFLRRTGLKQAGLRQARRAGLHVHRVGKRSFILGEDFFTFVREAGKRVGADPAQSER